MSSEPKLNVALKILKLAGHQIGDALSPRHRTDTQCASGLTVFLALLRNVLKMVEEEIKESKQPG